MRCFVNGISGEWNRRTMPPLKNVIPVMLGGDLNAYSVALSFKERYNVDSHVFTSYKCGATEHSRFIKTHLCSGIGDSSIALPELLSFAAENSGARLLLIPCSDSYLELTYEILDKINGIYELFIPKREHYFSMTDKASFYEILSQNAILYPKSWYFTKEDSALIDKTYGKYPMVLKPSRSAEYNKHSFKGKKKVFFLNSPKEVKRTVRKIYNSGYKGSVILQDKLSDNAESFVLTTLSNSDGRVARAVLAKVLLLEKTDSGYGNYSALMTVPLDGISLSLINMLNRLSYRGVANFDIMKDGDKYYCLEMNARQGRSCDYLRVSGISLAEFFLENTISSEGIKPDFSFKEVLWHYPRIGTVLKNLESDSDYKKAEKLYKQKSASTPFKNPYDGFTKKLYAFVHNNRLSQRFRRQKKVKN